MRVGRPDGLVGQSPGVGWFFLFIYFVSFWFSFFLLHSVYIILVGKNSFTKTYDCLYKSIYKINHNHKRFHT